MPVLKKPICFTFRSKMITKLGKCWLFFWRLNLCTPYLHFTLRMLFCRRWQRCCWWWNRHNYFFPLSSSISYLYISICFVIVLCTWDEFILYLLTNCRLKWIQFFISVKSLNHKILAFWILCTTFHDPHFLQMCLIY